LLCVVVWAKAIGWTVLKQSAIKIIAPNVVAILARMAFTLFLVLRNLVPDLHPFLQASLIGGTPCESVKKA